nr:hypothetical protein [Propionibacterium sp.]
MALFDRRSLPADARASLARWLAEEGLRGTPRVLAWAATPDGVLVALPDRLAIGDHDGWSSVPWHEVHGATWSDDGASFTWRTVADPRRSRTLAVTAPGRLPEVVRERVEQTFVVRRPVELAPGRGATVSGRRPADGAGELTWHLTPARGVSLADPALAEAARGVLERVRREWG